MAATIQHVRVDLRRRDVLVTEQLLDRAQVIAGFKQVRRETVPQCMCAERLGDRGDRARTLERA